MTKPLHEEPNIHRVSEDPDLPEMIREVDTAISDAGDFYDRNEHALDVRMCTWPGQTRDGRKHGTDEDPPFPWKGASDVRIRLVDMAIDEQVNLLLVSLQRMAIQVLPTKAVDAEWAGRMQALLRWYLHNEMADEADCEIELLANYYLTFGSAVLSVTWWQQLAYELHTVRIDELAAAAQRSGNPQALAKIATLLFDPAFREQAIALVRQFSSLLTKREAERVIKQLGELGAAEFPRPYVQCDRPQFGALQTFQDVYFPARTARLQTARWIAQRELITEPDILEKIENAEGWDEDFVKACLDQKGHTWNQHSAAVELRLRLSETHGVWSLRGEEDPDAIEIWHLYHRAVYRNVPTLYHTVFHPKLPEFWGAHRVLGYAHGCYPHVEFVRERKVRSILASRGLPELIDTQQSEIKVQRDARTDRTSITTLPPTKVKHRPGQKQLSYGPAVQVPVTNMNDLEVMNMGQPDHTSVEVEQATWRNVNEFLGRAGEGIDPSLVQARQQAEVARWLKRWNVAGKMTLQLAQQYTAPLTVGRVTGLIARPYEVDRESIAGQFSLLCSFDARYANPEFVFSLLERMEKYVLPMDSNAIINRDALIRYTLASIDPTLADIAVRDSQTASQSEIEDELNNLVWMVGGVEPPMKLTGENHQARLQTLTTQLQRNPIYQEMAQTRPDFVGMVERRIKFLTQQVTQQQNKIIGLYGTTPSAGSAGGEALTGMPGAMPAMNGGMA